MKHSFAVLFPQPTPLAFLDMALLLVCLVLQATLFFLAIRLYRAKPEEPLRFIAWASFCYLIPQAIRLVLVCVSVANRYPHLMTPSWYPPVRELFFVLFLLFLIRALRSFIRGRQVPVTPAV